MMTDQASSRGEAKDVLFRDLPDEAATERLGAALAGVLKAGDVVALSGSLGAGKTALARAIIRAFLPGEEVPSPTFSLVQIYEAPGLEIAHFDLYRLESADEVLELGLDDMREQTLVLIEWPERLGGHLPEDRLDVRLWIVDGTRTATLSPQGRFQWRGTL